jgi:uncharacterized glyoxalase superfamily protein PhnB
MRAEFHIGDSILMLADEFPSHEAFAPCYCGSPVSVVLCVENVDARVDREHQQVRARSIAGSFS